MKRDEAVGALRDHDTAFTRLGLGRRRLNNDGRERGATRESRERRQGFAAEDVARFLVEAVTEDTGVEAKVNADEVQNVDAEAEL